MMFDKIQEMIWDINTLDEFSYLRKNGSFSDLLLIDKPSQTIWIDPDVLQSKIIDGLHQFNSRKYLEYFYKFLCSRYTLKDELIGYTLKFNSTLFFNIGYKIF